MVHEAIKITFARADELGNGRGVETGEIDVNYKISKEYFKGYRLIQEEENISFNHNEIKYLSSLLEDLKEIGETQKKIMKKKNSSIRELEVIIK